MTKAKYCPFCGKLGTLVERQPVLVQVGKNVESEYVGVEKFAMCCKETFTIENDLK